MTLATRLKKIESSGLIRLAQRDPEVEYIFRHALVQDATYESLLKVDRRTLHQAVGQTLEILYPDRLDDIAATLAFHFERAEQPQKAFNYYIRAGEAAARIYAVDEAIDLFHHALEIIPDSVSNEELIHLYSQYGRVLELAGRFDVVFQVYEQMRADAVRRNDPSMELDALMARAILHSTPSPHQNVALAVELCERALPIARVLENREAQSRIYWILMLATLFEGRLKESIVYGEQSLEIARTLDNPERLAFILNDIARCYASNGLIRKSAAANREARELWKQLGNLPMLVDNLGSHAEYLFFGGEYAQGLAAALEAYEMAHSINNIWGQTFCLMILSFAYAEMGEMDRAIQASQELLSFDPRQTFPIAQIASLGQIAEIYAEFGNMEKGYGYLNSASEQLQGQDLFVHAGVVAGMVRYKLLIGDDAGVEELFEKMMRGYDPNNFTTFVPLYVERARHDFLTHKGQLNDALQALDQIIEIMDRLEVVFSRPEFMFRKANTLVALGRQDEALALLKDTAVLCERIGSRRILWRVYALAGDLQHEFGRPAEADGARHKARESLEFLLEHLPAELRQSFLQSPAVVRLLET